MMITINKVKPHKMPGNQLPNGNILFPNQKKADPPSEDRPEPKVDEDEDEDEGSNE